MSSINNMKRFCVSQCCVCTQHKRYLEPLNTSTWDGNLHTSRSFRQNKHASSSHCGGVKSSWCIFNRHRAASPKSSSCLCATILCFGLFLGDKIMSEIGRVKATALEITNRERTERSQSTQLHFSLDLCKYLLCE